MSLHNKLWQPLASILQIHITDESILLDACYLQLYLFSYGLVALEICITWMECLSTCYEYTYSYTLSNHSSWWNTCGLVNNHTVVFIKKSICCGRVWKDIIQNESFSPICYHFSNRCLYLYCPSGCCCTTPRMEWRE